MNERAYLHQTRQLRTKKEMKKIQNFEQTKQTQLKTQQFTHLSDIFSNVETFNPSLRLHRDGLAHNRVAGFVRDLVQILLQSSSCCYGANVAQFQSGQWWFLGDAERSSQRTAHQRRRSDHCFWTLWELTVWWPTDDAKRMKEPQLFILFLFLFFFLS